MDTRFIEGLKNAFSKIGNKLFFLYRHLKTTWCFAKGWLCYRKPIMFIKKSLPHAIIVITHKSWCSLQAALSMIQGTSHQKTIPRKTPDIKMIAVCQSAVCMRVPRTLFKDITIIRYHLTSAAAADTRSPSASGMQGAMLPIRFITSDQAFAVISCVILQQPPQLSSGNMKRVNKWK